MVDIALLRRDSFLLGSFSAASGPFVAIVNLVHNLTLPLLKVPE